MSSKGKYGEPWIHITPTMGRNGPIIYVRTAVQDEVMDVDHHERAVACVNACNGLDPAALPEFIEAATHCIGEWRSGPDYTDTDMHRRISALMDAARKLGVMGEGKQ